MMNTTTTTKKELSEKLKTFLNQKPEKLETGTYKAKLISYGLKERDDGRVAILMNFTVEDHSTTLFRYQIADMFDQMVAQNVKAYLEHNGYDVEEAENFEILELMKEVYVPIYYQEVQDNYNGYKFNFNKR